MTETSTVEAPAPKPVDLVKALAEEHCLSRDQAESIVEQDISIDVWTLREPRAAADAIRAKQYRVDFPWLTARQARVLVGRGPADAERMLDEEASKMSGLSAVMLSKVLAKRVDDETATAEQPFWPLVQERAQAAKQRWPESSRLQAIRYGRADGSLKDYPPIDEGTLWERAKELRSRWPVLWKRAALRAARFDLNLEQMAQLRPALFAKLPRAMALLEAHPQLHRKEARALARRNADAAQVADFLKKKSIGQGIWTELLDQGPLCWMTTTGVVEGTLDTDHESPRIFRLTDGTYLEKTKILLAFSQAQRGAILGRLKPVADVEALDLQPMNRAFLPPLPEEVQQAAEAEQRVRVVLCNGRAIAALPLRCSQYDYLMQTKGGLIVVLRHAVYRLEPQQAAAADAKDESQRKKGRRKGKKKR